MDQEGPREVFFGVTQAKFTCSGCSYNQVKNEKMSYLDLNLSTNGRNHSTVTGCLKALFTSENALGGYQCDKCKQPDTTTKSLSIYTAPIVLMLHLQRLVVEKKIQRPVKFNAVLDLSPYIEGQEEALMYDLISVVVHKGSHTQGHYTAFTKRGQVWNHHDDLITSPIKQPDVLKHQAYILMYRARDVMNAAENAPALAPDDAAAATNLAADTTLVVESAVLLTDGALATGCEGAASDGADAAVKGAGCGSGSGGRGRGRGGRGRGSAHNFEQNQPDAAIAVRLSQEAFVPRVTRSGGAIRDSA
jgi:hypothetical protein